MKTSGNAVLITGGATGFGFALAEQFVKRGNTVIICGRRQERLSHAKETLPSLNTIRCDISRADDRKSLYDAVTSNFKEINVLANNAGIQRPIDLKKGAEDLLKTEDEIEINLGSQIYLAALFIPAFMKRKDAAIINVSSGLGIIPLARFPVYCATKAAIRSFTASLRQQPRETAIKVFDVIPPTLYDTELKGKPIEKTDWTISAGEMADAVMDGLENDMYEITAGTSTGWLAASREDSRKIFGGMNR